MLVFQALVAAFAVLMLVRHGPRALLFAAPSLLRSRVGPPEPARSSAEQRARDTLAELGFRDAAALQEGGPAGALRVRWSVVSDGATYADVDPRGAVRFVSPCPGGILVTAAYRRAAVSGRGGRAAGLPGATPAAALAAHRAGLARFAAEHGAPSAPSDQTARAEAARRWSHTLGRSEVRLATGVNFVNALLAVALLAASMKALLTALK